MSLSTANENLTAGMSATVIANTIPQSRSIQHVGVHINVLSPVLAGVLFATVRWTEQGSARAHTFAGISLLVAQAFPFQYLCIVRDAATDITVETTLVGVLGTPTYSVFTLTTDEGSI